MIFEDKIIILKDGNKAIFKSPSIEDTEKMLSYIKKSCEETNFLARLPEEWDNVTVEQEKSWIERLRSSQSSVAISCYIDGEIAGNCEINFKGSKKTSHRSTVAIAILKKYWNLGIGTKMFEELIEIANKQGVEIIELQYIEGNERAKKLYEKFGFIQVAVIPKAFKLKDGTYQNEVYMQKYI